MTSSAVRTAARVASEMPGLPLRTRLTVASLTPACFATSASFRAMPQFYDKRLQSLQRPTSVDQATAARLGDRCQPRVNLERAQDAPHMVADGLGREVGSVGDLRCGGA